MPRFGFKQLFLCIALIAIGMALLRLAFNPLAIGDETAQGIQRISCFVISGAFFGAGVAAPFKRAGLGAAIGPVAMVLGIFLFALLAGR